MTKLKTDEAITRFSENEERVDNFVNGPGYYTTNNIFVKGLQAALYAISTFTDRGSWQPSTAYAIKDLVKVDSTWYVALVAHTSSLEFATDVASKWRVYQGVTSGDLSSSSGSGIVGWIQNGIGAVFRWVKDKLAESVSFEDFGALGGTANDSAAWNKAILAVALKGGGKIKATLPTYTLLNTIVVPSNITIDLGKASITGPGIGSTTDLFQSGYLSEGAMISNIGTADESHLVFNTQIKNGNISNCGKAFNLFNFIDNCEVKNIKFYDCKYAVYAGRSWYSRYVNLFSRGSAGGATNPAFVFVSFVNVQQIESVFVEGRTGYGIEIAGGANGQKLLNCSVENCQNGVLVSNASGPLEFDTCYFEAIPGIAINLNTGGRKDTISFNNNWFNVVGTAVVTEKTGGATLFFKENNKFFNVTTKIDCGDDYYNFGKIEIPPTAIENNGLPSLPSGYSIGKKMRVDNDAISFDSLSGLPLIKTKVHGSTLLSFEHEGNAGNPKDNTIAFCSHAKTAGTTFSVVVDTKINWSRYAAILVYRISIVDNNATYELFGFVFGDSVKQMDSNSKTVSVSNNGGFVRITIGNFSHPSGIYEATGIVRHV